VRFCRAFYSQAGPIPKSLLARGSLRAVLILAFAVKTWVLDPAYNPSALSGLAMSSRIYVSLFSGTTLYLAKPTLPHSGMAIFLSGKSLLPG
jgi:hypothetical protein